LLTYNPLHLLDVNNLFRKFSRMSLELPVKSPWLASRANKWDSMTFNEFLNKTCWTWFAREIGILICRSVLCAEPHEVSLLLFLCSLSSGHGLGHVVRTTNGSQESKFVGGSMQLSERMAEELSKGSVKLASPVIWVA